MSKRTDEEKKALWAQYQAVVLKEAGIEPTRELIGSILSKMQQIKFKQVLFDDVLPTLNKLKNKGLILGLISNIDSDIVPLFHKLGLTPLLQVVVTSQEAGYSKPQPEIFREAIRQAGVRAEEAIYVGDQYQVDVIGATKAGMQGILLDRGGFFKEATENLKIRNLHQLLEHLP
jgi:putative hydrolase of the HAD superfamily